MLAGGAMAPGDGSARAVPAPAAEGFSAVRLERVFAHCFADRWRTLLLGGAEEPFYQPAAGQDEFHRLYYRSDFFASALHEVAHWCIAGERRRQLPDFGYWYAPDGRSPLQQAAFEAAEAKPQALEWFLSIACGYPFRVSVDNLGAADGELPDTAPFRLQVLQQARQWQETGLPPRAEQFFCALASEFALGLHPADIELDLAALGAL